MALEGHGIAFLPLSAVKKEVRAKKLVSAGSELEMLMEVRIYRERPGGKAMPKSQAQALWNYLQAPAASRPAAKSRPGRNPDGV
jgi:hypothetical protein